VLEINGARLHHYQTLYFDTRDFALYSQHHNGQRARYKVRVREYLDSEMAFLEVKRKTNQNRTIKSRLQTPGAVPEIDERAGGYRL
jgi:SPX domain protein involved in polyphosphate accumulation